MIGGYTVKNKKQSNMKKRERHLLAMAALPIIQIFIFCYIPMFGLIIAFKDYRYNKGIFGSDWVGFDNFKFFLTSSDFSRIAWNTIYLNFVFIIMEIIFAVLVAVLLFEITSRKATKVYQTVMITPNFLSWVVVSYMVYAFLNPNYGFVNSLLSKIGLEKTNWYGEAKYWPAILTISVLWKGVGMKSIYYYAGLMGIDTSLFEAAEIDGANKVQQIRYIMLPCLRQLVVMLFILSVGNIFRADFGLFYQVPRNIGALYPTTDVMDTYIFRALKEVGDMSMSSAAGFLQSVVGLITVMLTNLIAKKIDSDSALF